MTKYFNNFTRNCEDPDCFEHPVRGLITVPDAAISIRILADRYTVGRGVPSLEAHAVYDEEDDLFIEKMDTLERHQLRMDVSHYIEEQKSKLKPKAKSTQPASTPDPAPAPAPTPAPAPAPLIE